MNVPPSTIVAYPELSQIFKMDFLVKRVNGWMPIYIFAIISIIDGWLNSKCASAYNMTEWSIAKFKYIGLHSIVHKIILDILKRKET